MNNVNLQEFRSNYWLGCIPFIEGSAAAGALARIRWRWRGEKKTATVETGRTRMKNYKMAGLLNIPNTYINYEDSVKGEQNVDCS